MIKRKPRGRIGYPIFLLGLFMLIVAIRYSHNVSALIGIALIFWGALLSYIKPIRFIKKDLLDSTIIDPLKYIDKLLNELEFKGTPIYIPFKTQKGIKSATIFIPRSDSSRLPEYEELLTDKIIMNNPIGIKMTPPGLGIYRLIENELKTDFSSVKFNYIENNLEKTLVDGLEIVKEFKIQYNNLIVQVELRETIFDEFSEDLEDLSILRKIGDPLISALACIFTISADSPVHIEEIKRESNQKIIHILYKIE